MKTNVYIDGGNLYYGLLRDNHGAKWLPDVIPIGTHGRTIHRPPAWAAPASAQ